jgi:bis(5'-nucleosyl)-tetraphosphatase (symmetrical)
MRLVRDLREGSVCVLGNHDLHLLAASVGARHPRVEDTFADVLAADDRDELLEWLRHRPLLHHDARLGFTLVHAAIPPQWDLASASARARELEAALRGTDWRSYLGQMYGDEPTRWCEDLEGADRLRYITNAFTRLRYCESSGAMRLEPTDAPEKVPHLIPWFAVPGRRTCRERILFGHWSTLGAKAGLDTLHRVYHLDEGCVWGGCLTALRLDDRRYFRVHCG